MTLGKLQSEEELPPGRRHLASWLPHVFDLRNDPGAHFVYTTALLPKGLPPSLEFLGFDDEGPFARGPFADPDPTGREVEWFQADVIYDD